MGLSDVGCDDRAAPALISNTDRDSIFPLDGVVRVHRKVRKVYDAFGKSEDLALHITAGPHKDTQELRVHAFRWFNKYLKGNDELIDKPAKKFFKPQQLRVFEKLPSNAINADVHDTFNQHVIRGENVPLTEEDRVQMRKLCFGGWPQDSKKTLTLLPTDRRDLYVLKPQLEIRLPVRAKVEAESDEPINIRILAASDFDENGQLSQEWMKYWAEANDTILFAPRGIGETRFVGNKKQQTQFRRRFYLLGQTLEGMQTFDIMRMLEAVRNKYPKRSFEIWPSDDATMTTLLSAGFSDGLTEKDTVVISQSEWEMPIILNLDRFLSKPNVPRFAGAKYKVVTLKDEK